MNLSQTWAKSKASKASLTQTFRLVKQKNGSKAWAVRKVNDFKGLTWAERQSLQLFNIIEEIVILCGAVGTGLRFICPVPKDELF